MRSATRSLNLILGRWQNRGVNLWKVGLFVQQLATGQSTYPVDASIVSIMDAYIRVGSGNTGVFILNESRLNEGILGPVSIENQITNSTDDRIIGSMSRNEYASLPNKQQTGVPTSYWFDRSLIPSITVWQVPDSDNYSLQYYGHQQVMTTNFQNGETLDMPQRFMEAFTAELASHLAMKWAADKVANLKSYAQEVWQEAEDEDREKVTMTFYPSFESYYS